MSEPQGEMSELIQWLEFYVLNSLKDNMYKNRGYDKCVDCLAMIGHAHQTYCSLNDTIKKLDEKIKELKEGIKNEN